jgi:nicotinate-nucleotide adenylyltransferase
MTATLPMIVLLGGSFDPVHDGHLKTAEALRDQLGAATVALLPAARSPLKSASTPDVHRLAMLQVATANHKGLKIDTREMHRPPPSYTVDTLLEMRAEHGPDVSLVWVMGSDILHTLAQWKDWQTLTQLAHLLVVNRPGAEWPWSGVVADWLAHLPSVTSLDQLQCSPCGKLARIELPPQPFSSTGIRSALQQRRQDSEKPAGLPDGVWQYILEHDLYLSDCGHEAT